MLNQKEIMIIDQFYKNQDIYLTSKDIAKELKVTEKTARKYIKQLNQTLDKKIVQIRSVPGHGFKLDIQNEETFKYFYQTRKRESREKKSINYIESSSDRQYYILKKICLENEMLFLDDIQRDLAISQSTLINDIQNINKKLGRYELSLKNSKKKGASIEGREQNKRHFIMNYFFLERLQNNLKSLGEISTLLTTISPEEILLIVLDECRNAKLKLNDTVMLNIVTHISLALQRIKEGYQINFNQEFDFHKYKTEYTTAERIVIRLRKSSDIELPHEEIKNIALHLKNKSSKSSFINVDKRTEFIQKEIKFVLEMVKRDTGISLMDDSVLINGLLDHFSPFLERLRNNNKLTNPVLKEIQSNYNNELELTKHYFSQMSLLKDYDVSEDEWAYLSLHIIAALERTTSREKKNTLVICATGLGSSQMLKVRLEHELGTKLNIVKVISYYEICDEVLEGIDLIVSSIDLSNVVFNIPVVNVSVLLNEADIKLINESFASRTVPVLSQNIKVSDENNRLDYLIKKYFSPDLFYISNTINSKNEALDILVEKSIQLDSSVSKSFLINQLKLRENFSTVVFSEYVAVPHPLEGVGDIPRVGVIITPKGISWDDASKEVKLTLLILPDRLGNNELDEVSKSILPIIENDEYLNELVSVKDFKEF
ncbi:MAG: BglG family transcription antiterminator, partial [Alkalibacterium gilvum]